MGDSVVLLHMQKTLIVSYILFLAASALAQQPAPESPSKPLRFVEKEMWVPVPRSFPRGVDALEVYAEGTGRRPLALLTHGTSVDPIERMRVTPWSMLNQAIWFARRGYVSFVVVRRGYGRSGGDQDGILGGCSLRETGGFEHAGDMGAEDLRAVAKYASQLPEVDASTIISTGISTGGFAQIALASDPPPGLKAVINFAGGRGSDGHEHNCNVSQLRAAFGYFGKGARKHPEIAILSIYSENDHFFPPEMARQFDAAFVKSGAMEQFVMAPPDGSDGHHLFSHVDAWSDSVNSFLREHALLPLGDQLLPGPTPPPIPPPPGLPAEGIAAWQRFLLGGPFKAFATNGLGAWGNDHGAFEQELADNGALDRCRQAAAGKGNCAIFARTPGAK